MAIPLVKIYRWIILSLRSDLKQLRTIKQDLRTLAKPHFTFWDSGRVRANSLSSILHSQSFQKKEVFLLE
jgi:hypothetical protein